MKGRCFTAAFFMSLNWGGIPESHRRNHSLLGIVEPVVVNNDWDCLMCILGLCMASITLNTPV